MTTLSESELGITGFYYADLYAPDRLADLLARFDDALRDADPSLFDEYRVWRDARGANLDAVHCSDLLVRVAPHVGEFIARLMGTTAERAQAMQVAQRDMEMIFDFKRAVVDRAGARFRNQDIGAWDLEALDRDLELLKRAAFPEAAEDPDDERATALVGARLAAWAKHYEALAKGKPGTREQADAEVEDLRAALTVNPQAARRFAEALARDDPAALVAELLDGVARWCHAALVDPACAERVRDWASFRRLKRTDFEHLVARESDTGGPFTSYRIRESQRRKRDGFGLTDPRFPVRQVEFEVDHCIYCHDRDRDSCSKGMRHKDGTLHVNPLGVTLAGCPLEEKISEAHLLKRGGDNLAALALIMIDNPMCPGTGHRICNDCMKACIYQKVEPVDIPQIETNILTDVLFMPYGFEIYSLLTRFNPLNAKRPVALPYNGKNVLVVGMGPAGYTLSHYLLNEGFAVAGIDALKIEPLPARLTGTDGATPEPIRDFHAVYEDLDKRVMAGFGGVAEYGITVRWDKNFLKVIQLALTRRHTFACHGGVRFGGTLTVEDAWELGFDHVAIAAGAGKPTIVGLKNNLIRGVRKASDFLMALQLTGAAKRSSMANLQIQLPAGVIGGGLTAIDTATELLAYYPVQVEKLLDRYEILGARYGVENIRDRYDSAEIKILDEFLEHGRAVRAERTRARAAGETPDFLPLLRAWGGVTLYYRKRLEDSPAYRQNHEEVAKALEEGVVYAPCLNPVEAYADADGQLAAINFEHQIEKDGHWTRDGEPIRIPMRSLLVAAGTSPNIIYETEHPGTFELDGKFFRRYAPAQDGGETPLEAIDEPPAGTKRSRPAPFTSYTRDGHRITFFGDNHPVYAGNVVKAMASARDGYPHIVKLFATELAALDAAGQHARDQALTTFQARLRDALTATVSEVHRLTPKIVEVIAHAPMQARQFHPGQFYRIQNLESLAPVIDDTALAAEGMALTGAWVDKERGMISLITLEMGTSSRLCALWKPGQEIVAMGPTGTPTEIPEGETVLLCGGGLGNAVLFSIGKKMRARGNRILYFAGYKSARDLFKVDEIEAASDVIVWSVDPAPDATPIPTTRPQDKSAIGNIVQTMQAYAEGRLGATEIAFESVDRLIAIGSDRMMAAVKAARFGPLQPYLKPDHKAIGSINSTMQCMMKGVCAQCLCRHTDPATGEESFVYSCFNQDQPLDCVDFTNLQSRLRQNSVQEKLSNLWLEHLLEAYGESRI